MPQFLFIDWAPDNIALDLGFFAIRWYSLCWCAGLLGVYMLMHRLFRQQKLTEEQFEPMFMYCFVGIIVGARLGHCLFYEPEYYLSHIAEMLLPMKQMADGSWSFTGYEGLASHGGTLGLMLALVLYARSQKIPLLHVLDNVGIVTPICACAIRLGNLMNSEIIGKVSDVPWAFRFFRSGEAMQTVDSLGMPLPRHPGQLYEALCYALFFWIGWGLYRKAFRQHEQAATQPSQATTRTAIPYVGTGFYFGLCLFLIFTSRIFIEYTKENQVSFEDGMLLNMGQLLSVPFVLLGTFCMWRAFKAQNNKNR